MCMLIVCVYIQNVVYSVCVRTRMHVRALCAHRGQKTRGVLLYPCPAGFSWSLELRQQTASTGWFFDRSGGAGHFLLV